MAEPLRVLVVDDDRAHAEFVAELIRFDVSPDARVDVAHSYHAALERFAAAPFDVAVVDYMLDVHDGLALLRELRARGDDTPVIMLTGHGGEQVAVEAMKSGAADYVGKANLSGESLAHAIRHALSLAAKEREKREAEQALRASEERFRALVENSSDLLVLLDRSGRVTYITPATARHFGWRRNEVLGQAIYDFLHPDDVSTAQARLGDALVHPGESVDTEMRVRHSDGTYRTTEAVGVNRLYDPAVGAIVVNARDVSERRRLEEQLRQVQKMEAIGRLAGGIAHDFNNLLTAILGYCNLLLDDLPAESPLRPDLDEIRKAGDRAATLTRQLLAFSRRQMLQPQPVDVPALLQHIEKMIRRLVGEDIEVVLAVEHRLPLVKADPASIEQIVINLAVNARDAMPTGGRLAVGTAMAELDDAFTSLHPGAVPGRFVRLTVSDTGQGMNASTRAKIFEPFFTTREQGRGTGLGLATVYGLVKQSGGYIWVDSEPGQGTVFSVYLPPIERDFAPPAIAAGRQAAGETVLLVEDEDAVRAVGAQALRRSGYAVLEARHPLDALRLAERHQETIDLVVTDVVMPHMTGRELADRLRDARPSLKVLFISGYTDHAAVRAELESGAAFLQKPFTPESFARKVREMLDSRPRQ